MKKVALFILIISFFLIPTIARAQDSITPRKTPTQNIQTTQLEAKERSASREAQKKERLEEVRKAIATKFFVTMITRFEAAIERLDQILDRIESRVDKIKSESPSTDLADVESQIASVKDDILDTQAKINTLKDDFNTALVSTSPSESIKTIKADTAEIKRDLENIKKNLSKIIGDIKGLRVGQSKTRI